jgi:DNA excision repair protein ERCC-2
MTNSIAAAGDETMKFTIAVRELCEFTAKTGDLDLRFTPAPTAQEGIEGHRVVAARRGAGYQAERALQAEFGALRLRGRCDGFDPGQGLLEEVKTYRGDITRLPQNQRELHWAQAMMYGAMICAEDGLAELNVAVVYFDIGDQKETPITRHFTAAELQEFFSEQCTRFLRWAEQEMAHRAARDQSLLALKFPHPDFRYGQRLLAEGVYRAARDGQCLMAQAPTGIGKTIGTLFPLLKAMPGQQIDRAFFLTAKTPGRALALEAARLLMHTSSCGSGSSLTAQESRCGTAVQESATAVRLKPDPQDQNQIVPPVRLRVLELTARDKACVHPDKECHGESCLLAKGFYDRLPAARAEAVAIGGNNGGGNVESGLLDQPALQRITERHAICPYYLSQELARWSDVIVGDYNYYFDSSALLHALTQSRDWKVALLVDEAHNLIDRAREMYSAELNPAALAALRKTAPGTMKRALSRLQNAWDELHETGLEYETRDELPASFVGALQGAIVKIADYQAEHPLEMNPELLRFYFDALHFQNLLECLGPWSPENAPAPCGSGFSLTAALDPGAVVRLKPDPQKAPDQHTAPALQEKHSAHSFIDITTPPPGRGARLLRVRNVIPAPFLAPRIAAAHALTLFSATLTPPELYRHLLGLPATTAFLDVPSPFAAAQLEVRIVDRISTRYRDREASLAPIAALMAAQYRRRPGNYLAFFSSHDYLQRALAVFRETHPGIPVREQAREMSEAARAEFLQGFGVETKGIAFAVLGGAFGEGIDLPGERLIGAFVATLGLPQVNAMNEKIKALLQAQFGAGYDYTYLYPGLQKVVQAAGRVIRTREDAGVVYLIDDRFMQGQVQALLPAWWEPRRDAERPAGLTLPVGQASA